MRQVHAPLGGATWAEWLVVLMGPLCRSVHAVGLRVSRLACGGWWVGAEVGFDHGGWQVPAHLGPSHPTARPRSSHTASP